jgi:hypothetical protein
MKIRLPKNSLGAVLLISDLASVIKLSSLITLERIIEFVLFYRADSSKFSPSWSKAVL